LVAVTPDANKGNGTKLHQVDLATDLSARLWQHGHDKVVRKWLSRIYKAGAHQELFSSLDKSAEERGGLHLCLSPLNKRSLGGMSYFGGWLPKLDTSDIVENGVDHAIAKLLEADERPSSINIGKQKEPASATKLEELMSRIFTMENMNVVTSRILKELK
jgi:hypothetical protein